MIHTFLIFLKTCVQSIFISPSGSVSLSDNRGSKNLFPIILSMTQLSNSRSLRKSSSLSVAYLEKRKLIKMQMIKCSKLYIDSSDTGRLDLKSSPVTANHDAKRSYTKIWAFRVCFADNLSQVSSRNYAVYWNKRTTVNNVSYSFLICSCGGFIMIKIPKYKMYHFTLPVMLSYMFHIVIVAFNIC